LNTDSFTAVGIPDTDGRIRGSSQNPSPGTIECGAADQTTNFNLFGVYTLSSFGIPNTDCPVKGGSHDPVAVQIECGSTYVTIMCKSKNPVAGWVEMRTKWDWPKMHIRLSNGNYIAETSVRVMPKPSVYVMR
jgi:hypothetical protein